MANVTKQFLNRRGQRMGEDAIYIPSSDNFTYHEFTSENIIRLNVVIFIKYLECFKNILVTDSKQVFHALKTII